MVCMHVVISALHPCIGMQPCCSAMPESWVTLFLVIRRHPSGTIRTDVSWQVSVTPAGTAHHRVYIAGPLLSSHQLGQSSHLRLDSLARFSKPRRGRRAPGVSGPTRDSRATRDWAAAGGRALAAATDTECLVSWVCDVYTCPGCPLSWQGEALGC